MESRKKRNSGKTKHKEQKCVDDKKPAVYSIYSIAGMLYAAGFYVV